MDFFDVLTLIGGLALFLFGMNVMGKALERRAGTNLKNLLGRLTGSKAGGIATGIGVTAVTQASSATTVMVVGFVNSRLMNLSQAINVIIGANVGTTITAWILSLNGISSENFWLRMLKPTSFTPVLAFIGVIMFMFSKKSKTKETGTVLLGFATLMTGMASMTASVGGLSDLPKFRELLVAFDNPLLGVLMGTLVTALIQSSAASIGILQALAATGQVSVGASIPIVMGQNIGTCITAVISSFGATKNGKRAALAHLMFNVIGTAVYLTVFCVVKAVFAPALLSSAASLYGIAAAHTIFNVLTMLIVAPFSSLLEKLVKKMIGDGKNSPEEIELDERLFAAPALAAERSRVLTLEMGQKSIHALNLAMKAIFDYSEAEAREIRELEEVSDHYEDVISTYLVKISGYELSDADSAETGFLLKVIGDYERISDHAVNILESAEEIKEKNIELSPTATKEIKTLIRAATDINTLAYSAFTETSAEQALLVEPLEQVIDDLKEQMRTNHIDRLRKGECSVDAGFVLSDLLTNLERVSDHCSNIAGAVIDYHHHDMKMHESVRALKEESEEFNLRYEEYSAQYSI